MDEREAFRAATDRVAAAGVPMAEIAEGLGVSRNDLSRMRRLDESESAIRHRNLLHPPDGWRERLARVAVHVAEAKALAAAELRAIAAELRE